MLHLLCLFAGHFFIFSHWTDDVEPWQLLIRLWCYPILIGLTILTRHFCKITIIFGFGFRFWCLPSSVLANKIGLSHWMINIQKHVICKIGQLLLILYKGKNHSNNIWYSFIRLHQMPPFHLIVFKMRVNKNLVININACFFLFYKIEFTGFATELTQIQATDFLFLWLTFLFDHSLSTGPANCCNWC